jgi:hypothetical protein
VQLLITVLQLLLSALQVGTQRRELVSGVAQLKQRVGESG